MVENKIIAFTGHTNIEKCCGLPVPENGNVYDKSAYDRVYNDLSMFMEKLSKLKNIPLNNFKIVSGMARGFDEVVAMYAINMNLDLILSIPHSTVELTYRHKALIRLVPVPLLRHK